jgi:hypothetical protein
MPLPGFEMWHASPWPLSREIAASEEVGARSWYSTLGTVLPAHERSSSFSNVYFSGPPRQAWIPGRFEGEDGTGSRARHYRIEQKFYSATSRCWIRRLPRSTCVGTSPGPNPVGRKDSLVNYEYQLRGALDQIGRAQTSRLPARLSCSLRTGQAFQTSCPRG